MTRVPTLITVNGEPLTVAGENVYVLAYSTGLPGEVSRWCPHLDTIGQNTATLNDLIGPNHGTLTGMVTSGAGNDWVIDSTLSKTVLDFNGGAQRVVCGTNGIPTGAAARTLAVWFLRRTSTINGLIDLNSQGTNQGFGLISQSNFAFTDSSTNANTPPSLTITGLADNTWQHLAMTLDASGNYAIYLNGASVLSGTWTSPTVVVNTVVTSVWLGARNVFTTASLDGRLADAIVANVAWSAQQISDLYALGPAGVVASSSPLTLLRRRRWAASQGLI